MHKVPSVPAASVKDTHPGRDISSQDLIEDVDIDLAELILHVHRNLSNFHSLSIDIPASGVHSISLHTRIRSLISVQRR
jgi:hypothetical protein